MGLSLGEKLMRAASATENNAFFHREAMIALDAAVAAVTPTHGQPGKGARLLDAANKRTVK